MDLALLAHLYQALVPLVDSGSKGGGFIGTASTTTSNSDRSRWQRLLLESPKRVASETSVKHLPHHTMGGQQAPGDQ